MVLKAFVELFVSSNLFMLKSYEQKSLCSVLFVSLKSTDPNVASIFRQISNSSNSLREANKANL